MENKVKVSLIVAVYKRIDFLELVLASVKRQSYKNFEVIIAEDDKSQEVKEYIDRARSLYSFKIEHLSQDDKGFRKNKILNAAVKHSCGEYLIFIDGDCILHRNFLKEYMKRADPDSCLFGRRVMLGKKTTDLLIQTGNLKYLSLFQLVLRGTRKVEEALFFPVLARFSRRQRKILGCNFCIPRRKMIEINGFDEDFERPLYGEDTDVWRRLVLAGVKMVSTKFTTIQYHMHHEVKGRKEDWKHSGDLYRKKCREGASFCRNGLTKTH